MPVLWLTEVCVGVGGKFLDVLYICDVLHLESLSQPSQAAARDVISSAGAPFHQSQN